MALQANGAISIGDVNSEFSLGNVLGSYKKLTHLDIDDGIVKDLPSTPLKFSDFYNIVAIPEFPHNAPTITTNGPRSLSVFSNTGKAIFRVQYDVDYGLDAEGRPPIVSKVTQLQWYLSSDGGSSWSVIPGENKSTLAVPTDLAANGYKYRVEIYAYKTAAQDEFPYDPDALGPVSIVVSTTKISDEVTLIVTTAPAVTPAVTSTFTGSSIESVDVNRHFLRDGVTPSQNTTADNWQISFSSAVQSVTSQTTPGRSPTQVTTYKLQESTTGAGGSYANVSLGDNGDVFITENYSRSYLFSRFQNIDRNGNHYRMAVFSTVTYTGPSDTLTGVAYSSPVQLNMTLNDIVQQNIPPTANRINVEVLQGSSIDIYPANYNWDADGDTMTLNYADFDTRTSVGGHTLTTNLGTGLVRFTPNPSFFGSAGIYYRLTDGFDNGAYGVISVSVAEVIPPTPESIANPNAFTVPFASANNILDPLANDVNNAGSGSLSIVAASVQPGSAGSVTIVSGGSRIRYDAPSGRSGAQLINYTMQDGIGRQYNSQISVNIAAEIIPDARIIGVTTDAATISESSSPSFTVTTKNARGKNIRWTLSGLADSQLRAIFPTTTGVVRLPSFSDTIRFSLSSRVWDFYLANPTLTITISSADATGWSGATASTTFTVNDKAEEIFIWSSPSDVLEGAPMTFNFSGKNVTDTSVPWSISGLSAGTDVGSTSGTVTLVWNGSRYTGSVTVPTVLDGISTVDKTGSFIVARSAQGSVPIVLRNVTSAIEVLPFITSSVETSAEVQVYNDSRLLTFQDNGTIIGTSDRWSNNPNLAEWDIEVISSTITENIYTSLINRPGTVTGEFTYNSSTMTLSAAYRSPQTTTVLINGTTTTSDLGLYRATGRTRVVGTYRARHRSTGLLSSNSAPFDITYIRAVTGLGDPSFFSYAPEPDPIDLSSYVNVDDFDFSNLNIAGLDLSAFGGSTTTPAITTTTATVNNDTEYEAWLNSKISIGWLDAPALNADSFKNPDQGGYRNWQVVSRIFGSGWTTYIQSNTTNALNLSPNQVNNFGLGGNNLIGDIDLGSPNG